VKVVDNKGNSFSAENALARVLPKDTNTLDFATVGSETYEPNQLNNSGTKKRTDVEDRTAEKVINNAIMDKRSVISNPPTIRPSAELKKIKDDLNVIRLKEAERKRLADAEANAKAEREAAEAEASAKAEREAAEAEANAKAEREAAEAEANARAAEAEANAKAEREAAESEANARAEREAAEAEASAKAEREAAESEANAKAEREAAEAEAKAKAEREAAEAEAATDKVTIYKSTFSIVNDELIFLSENPISIEEIQEEDIPGIQKSYTTEYSDQKTCILLEAFSGENYAPIFHFNGKNLHQYEDMFNKLYFEPISDT
jgi:phage-related minor tail protein